MQMHKAQRHSGSHANLAVNRSHKRAKTYTGPNRAERREFDDVKGRYEAQKAALEALVGHPIVDVAGVTVS